MSVIEVADLVRAFRSRPEPALAGVTFSVERGEIVALAGRNGAGKTSLLDVLSTLLVPTAGRVRVAGHDVVAETLAVRRAVGYTMTGPRGFHERLTGRENLAFYAALHPGLAGERGRIDALVAALALAPFIDRQVRHYSDGMQQKLAVARSLLGRPAVLLLDEPMRALDPASRQQLRALIESLVGDGQVEAVVYATHEIDALRASRDRVLVLESGRLVYDGAPHEGPLADLFAAGAPP
ncbi:MAG: ABC transporter ATP-binding protein [Acidobacteriota bacterium]|nr:ABC transporter ATP-binding protein [Acidobacteriota bacterium]